MFNSGESTRNKHSEVDYIIDTIGEVIKVDSESQELFMLNDIKDGKIIKFADLVNDNQKDRDKKSKNYLR